ncbi:dodecaprenyl-phosphate galacturonate synthase [Abditibacteriota bacterium]|nr:dodecaprenyl-phosphate galacturonate synthase [Abditibacteriota bacterium]
MTSTLPLPTSTQNNGDAKPYLSVIVPVYNEEENVEILHQKIEDSLKELGVPAEILYVDDGSRDRSFELLDKISQTDSRVKVIRFRRNFGQTAAMSAGMNAAKGEILIPMDADLQNDPKDIRRLLDKMNEGYDVVSGWRKKRQDHIWRKIPSRMANGLISRVTGVQLHDYGCSLKAYRADVIKDVALYGEMHRFIPAYAAMAGGRVTEIPVDHHPRIHGQSKYGFGRIQKVALDLIVARFMGKFGQKPIYFFGGGALRATGLGILLWLIAVLQKISPGINDLLGGVYESRHLNSNPLFYIGILLFVAALQLLMMGLIAEMNMRIYYEAGGKPTYIVKETRNIEA